MDAPVRPQRRSRLDPPPTSCTFEGCDRPHFTAGLCQMHYTRRYRGQAMIGPSRRAARGQRRAGADGYVSDYAPESSAARADGWAFEHRVVMEQLIGRPLLPGENVHHINGLRGDNRSENLELWVKAQPSGQRAADLLEWAERIVATYAPLRDREVI